MARADEVRGHHRQIRSRNIPTPIIAGNPSFLHHLLLYLFDFCPIFSRHPKQPIYMPEKASIYINCATSQCNQASKSETPSWSIPRTMHAKHRNTIKQHPRPWPSSSVKSIYCESLFFIPAIWFVSYLIRWWRQGDWDETMRLYLRRTETYEGVAQIPIRVLRQCLLFALYLFFSLLAFYYSPGITALLLMCPTPSYSARLGERDKEEVGIVPDGVTGSQSDPLRNRSILLLSSCELLLRSKGLVALYKGFLNQFCVLQIE